MKKRLKINGIIIFFATIAVVFFPKFFFRIDSNMEWEALEIFGFALILFGQLIRVSARGYKAEHSAQSHALIQAGPYQIVRNPMYLGILFIGLGVVMAIFKLWAALIFILVFVIRYIALIHKEEKQLLKVFPREYKEYCRKVPRIFPSFAKLVKSDIGEYLPIKMVWFKKEIGSIICLLLFVGLVDLWKDIQKEGFATYLKEALWLLAMFILFAELVFLLEKHTEQKNENLTD